MAAGWCVVAVLAVVAVAGTRDHLVHQRAVWEVAQEVHDSGVPYTELDAGASWDGEHLYRRARADVAVDAEPDRSGGAEVAAMPLGSPHDVRPWWIDFYAPSITPIYVVAGDELDGYTTLRRVEYSSWLAREPVYLYVLRSDLLGP
jgi:hypothetical protein